MTYTMGELPGNYESRLVISACSGVSLVPSAWFRCSAWRDCESNHPFPVEGEQSQPPARKRTAEYGFLGPRACPTAELRQFKEMDSPQKQDEQRGARVHIQVARQPLASQAGDDPKPEDVTTDAATSGSNLVAFEAGLTARQDAFHRSNAEAGDPASGNVLTETIALGLGGPTAAGTAPVSYTHLTLPTKRIV